MSSAPPSDRGGIIMDYEYFCDEHLEQLEEFEISFMNIHIPILDIIMTDSVFFETCYRLKNGYGIPDSVDTNDIPESEQPGVEHINDALEEFSPVCCYIEDNRESETELPPFIEALAEKVNELQNE